VNSRLIRAAECQPKPWKNGLGVTREIMRSPAAADDASFLWRASVAEVNSAAPFSLFPGIDRHIALLDGAGFNMTLDGTQTHLLHTRYEPFAFPGEAHVTIALVDGPTHDFNLMVRRSHAHGSINVCAQPGRHDIDATCALLYVLHGSVDTPLGVLQAGDAWLPVTNTFFILHDHAQVFVIRIAPRTAGQ